MCAHAIVAAAVLCALDVPSQPLASALLEFSRQAELEFLAPAQEYEGRVSAPLIGRHQPADALRLLLVGTGCSGRIEDGVIRARCDAPAFIS